MAIYKRQEFAKKCGFSGGNLSNYIKRGKVILTNDGTIDSENLINAEFLLYREEQLRERTDEPEVQKPEVPVKPKKAPKARPDEFDEHKYNSNKLPKVTNDYDSLTNRVKRQELLKKEADTQLLLLRIAKQRGEHIPTDLVKEIVIQQSHAFITAFKNSLDDFITMIAKDKGMSVDEIAKYRGGLIKTINSTTSKAVETAKSNVKKIVKEYSESREVGEHD